MGSTGLLCRPWRAADRVFHTDPHWLGGDAAYSIALDDTRSVWLFGDSFVSARAGAGRGCSTVIRNCVAIQVGSDPTTASMEYSWRSRDDRVPDSFFAFPGDRWLWPGHGSRVGRSLLLFFMVVRSRGRATGDPFDFEVTGWTAGLVGNPDDAPPAWQLRELPTPRLEGRPWTVGSGGVVVFGGHVYAPAAAPGRETFLLRWQVRDAEAGRLLDPERWCGDAAGWQRSGAAARAQPVLRDAETEFTIHFDARRGRFVQVQSTGPWQGDLGVRYAESIEGPWSPVRAVFHPPEAERDDAWVYAVKAHPQLRGAGDLVLTYASNGRPRTVEQDMTLYFPRFVLARYG